ncbi:hypothetical protein [Hyphomonas sp. ND6WE1B]|uniref:TIR domain-containing protein n=1 Tax=Hyphomonas sp. ND6WE1B TaxID=1848191 RepID=UPI0011127358|nr:hypothetical protein [Hyphomonas sp. ND6WE1B]
MTYRNGVYVAFHAAGESNPTKSDMKYYNTLRMWTAHKDIDFKFRNSHEKTPQVRDTSLPTTLQDRLKERLRKSKSLILIATPSTPLDDDNVPFEIYYAVEKLGLPIIVTYPGFKVVLNPDALMDRLPEILKYYIQNKQVRILHSPFSPAPLNLAISCFSVHQPMETRGYIFTKHQHSKWKLLPKTPAPILWPSSIESDYSQLPSFHPYHIPKQRRAF